MGIGSACTAVVYMELMVLWNIYNIVENYVKHSNAMSGSSMC